MPYEVMWEDGGLVRRYFGEVTEDDVIASNREVRQNPMYSEIRYRISDYRDITNMSVSDGLAQWVAAINQEASEENPEVWDAVIASDARVKGLIHVYRISHEVMGGSWKTSIFTTVDEARDWIAERPH